MQTVAGKQVWRIRALKNIHMYGVKKGDLGGYVESEENLSQEGNCWIANNAVVWENAKVTEDALVSGRAQVLGSAIIKGFAKVT